MIKILCGGSPCTHWSIAQKNNRETTAEGIGWKLFKNFLIAKEKFRPDFFLYENNKSAAQPIKDQIAKEFGVTERSVFAQDNGVRMTYINSALVSAQNRQRFYCTNFGDIEQPADRGILLRDILESGTVPSDKSYCLKHQAGNIRDYFKKHHTNIAFEPVIFNRPHGYNEGGIAYDKAPTLTANGCYEQNHGVVEPCPIEENGTPHPVYEVRNGLITIKDKRYPIKLADGYYIIRKLTVKECCRLQTMPDNYCRAVSSTQAYKGLGNGWTAEVIIHLLNHALKDIPRNTEIECLAMYDGIGTGHYCLDKMGFKHVRYHAYEIDKYAMQIAMSNYPDIIQHGDVFQVREEGWRL